MHEKSRLALRSATIRDEAQCAVDLIALLDLDAGERAVISRKAADLVSDIRAVGTPGLMEMFLAQYGLTTDEGVALMCLAEAFCACPTPRRWTR